jgi:hypothetical protein
MDIIDMINGYMKVVRALRVSTFPDTLGTIPTRLSILYMEAVFRMTVHIGIIPVEGQSRGYVAELKNLKEV